MPVDKKIIDYIRTKRIRGYVTVSKTDNQNRLFFFRFFQELSDFSGKNVRNFLMVILFRASGITEMP